MDAKKKQICFFFFIYILFLANMELTWRKAALASSASADSAAMETSAVGVPAVGVAAGERRGLEVRENSSGGVP